MNSLPRLPVVPSLVSTNCSQPLQLAFGEPEQTPSSWLVLTCSEYASATAGPVLFTGPFSLVTFTVSNDPMTREMVPEGACAEMSFWLPTTAGRTP